MKILNLYAGIGGNRKLWTDDHNITAIEIDPKIAKIYQDFYPDDKVIVTDAHQYLLDNFNEYDFIWSSPPCSTHSLLVKCCMKSGQIKYKYPDIKLYQEIIFLNHFTKCKFVIENVRPYYSPLIRFEVLLNRHLFWSNFNIPVIKINNNIKHCEISGNESVYGISVKKYKNKNKRKILRNMVNPEIGKYILECAMNTDELFPRKLKID